MSTVVHGSARIHYEVTGSGPSTVLVHGTGSGGADLTVEGLAEQPEQFLETVLAFLA